MARKKLLPKKLPLQKKLTRKQDFNYSKGISTLNFVLNIDKKNLKDFKECLLEAIKDIDELLEE